MAQRPIVDLREAACAVSRDFKDCPLSPEIRNAIAGTPADGSGIGFRGVPLSCEQARELLAFFKCAAEAYRLKGDNATSMVCAEGSDNTQHALRVAGC